MHLRCHVTAEPIDSDRRALNSTCTKFIFLLHAHSQYINVNELWIDMPITELLRTD